MSQQHFREEIQSKLPNKLKMNKHCNNLIKQDHFYFLKILGNSKSMSGCFVRLLSDVKPSESEQKLFFQTVDGVDGQHQRLVLQHRGHIQAVHRHLL